MAEKDARSDKSIYIVVQQGKVKKVNTLFTCSVIWVAERCGLITAAVARQLRNANWAANHKPLASLDTL